MLIKRQTETEWIEAGVPGVQNAILWGTKQGDGGHLTRFEANARAPRHSHVGAWEQIYVVQGHLKLGGIDIRTGDTVYSQGDDEHDAVAIEETIVLVTHHGGTQPGE
ncbi:cupin domain-containing protein [Paraburkholderia sp. DHOC27]|uniref:cupin domain-containing protein n=1 Tax=Paraburkholderia sp. DHOC27 TaxID=2303330 RepID=UPI000E3D0C4E|nr:cupin domain-containing protein [Paraburkholderia sp. DHOC27]RFU49142.1 hypothetical protein D0B32_04840 [Paraburkholderia sp. DHOC27]